MNQKMDCFPYEQTAGCTESAGACGKGTDTAKLQDELTGTLIGLARAIESNEHLINTETDKLMIEALFATITNVNFDNETLSALKTRVECEKQQMVPGCYECGSPCGRNDNYDMNDLWNANEDIRSLKSLILFGIRGMAAYAYHAAVLGYTDRDINDFFYKALFAIGMKDWSMDELLPVVLEIGDASLKCMALLDKANTETHGTPVPIPTETFFTLSH